MSRSLFIVFEGIDGSGTTTQATLLRDYFLGRGERAALDSEPTDGPIGRLIRAAFQEGSFPLEDKDRFDEQMAYLFAADRHYHLYNDRDGVWKRLDRERTHVISTRYYFSSLAYNCNTPEEFAFVRQLNGRFPAPDIVFHLDVSPDVSLERIRHRTVREIYEEREKLARVRANYRAIFKDYEGRCCRLDGGGTIEEVHRNVVEYLESSR